MIWSRVVAVFLLCAGLLCLAQARPGPDSNYNKNVAAGGGGYVGPGDVLAAAAWFGLRGYSAAYSTGSNPGADVCDAATGLTCTTVNILSSGKFDAVTAAALPQCSVSCIVQKLYDQTGGGDHLISPTLTSGPVLTFSCTGLGASLPCMTFAGAQRLESVAATITQTQPLTFGTVGKRTGSTAAFHGLFGGTSSCSPGTFWDNASANFSLFAGSVVTSAATSENNWHSFVAVINNASSVLNVDNTETSGTAGVAALSSSSLALGACVGGSSPLTGTATEGGMWGSALSAGNRTALESNQKTFWGF